MTKIIIEEKLEFIQETLLTLKDILRKREKHPPFSEYLLFAAEKKAEEIIESAISINQEILKSNFLKLSSSYYDSFIDLKKLKVFKNQELTDLASTAGFRNRLAHDYLTLNKNITLKSLEKLLKIYPLYLKKIKYFIDRK